MEIWTPRVSTALPRGLTLPPERDCAVRANAFTVALSTTINLGKLPFPTLPQSENGQQRRASNRRAVLKDRRPDCFAKA